jgi:hypothetical protein
VIVEALVPSISSSSSTATGGVGGEGGGVGGERGSKRGDRGAGRGSKMDEYLRTGKRPLVSSSSMYNDYDGDEEDYNAGVGGKLLSDYFDRTENGNGGKGYYRRGTDGDGDGDGGYGEREDKGYHDFGIHDNYEGGVEVEKERGAGGAGALATVTSKQQRRRHLLENLTEAGQFALEHVRDQLWRTAQQLKRY